MILLGLGVGAGLGFGAARTSSADVRCLSPGGDPPGILAAGVYTTRCFLPGMRVMRRTTIAGHIPALMVDLDTATNAPRCDPSCPGPCMGYFIFRAPGITPTDTYGTGRGEPVRLYFAQIGPPTHLFAVNVDTPNKHVFATMNVIAAKMLATLRLPSKLPSPRGR